MSSAADLLERARDLYRRGAVGDALVACEQAADEARRTDDVAALADAATVIRTTARVGVAGRVHELCVEALARLGESDPVRTARVRAQLVATANPFGPPEPLVLPPESDDPEATFLRLQAWHAARLAIDHLPERLAIADEAVDLGRRTGTEEYAAWGRRWRMDAFAVLGDRIDLLAELQALQPLVERLDRPSWRAYLTHVECSQRLLEGRWEDAGRLADDAVAMEDDPMGEAAFFRVVTTSAVAQQTGRGLAESEAAVAALVDKLPYFARGWICLMYKATGKRDEAEALWRAIAPHVTRMPERAPEWVIATVGSAEVCAWLGDVDTARVLYDQLAPFAGLHAIGLSQAPYDGPVDLALGRLAACLGDAEAARSHLPPPCARPRRCTRCPSRCWCWPSSPPSGTRAARPRAGPGRTPGHGAGPGAAGGGRPRAADPPRGGGRGPRRRRAEQRRHRRPPGPLRAHGREPRQQRAPQARPHLPCRHRLLARARAPVVEEVAQRPSRNPVSGEKCRVS